MIRRSLALAAVLSPLCGCVVTASFIKTGDAPASHRKLAKVEVLTLVPQVPFQERGIIHLTGNYDAGIETVVARAKEAGVEFGCDAVVVNFGSRTSPSLLNVLSTNKADSTVTNSTATCIVYATPPDSSAVPAPAAMAPAPAASAPAPAAAAGAAPGPAAPAPTPAPAPAPAQPPK